MELGLLLIPEESVRHPDLDIKQFIRTEIKLFPNYRDSLVFKLLNLFNCSILFLEVCCSWPCFSRWGWDTWSSRWDCWRPACNSTQSIRGGKIGSRLNRLTELFWLLDIHEICVSGGGVNCWPATKDRNVIKRHLVNIFPFDRDSGVMWLVSQLVSGLSILQNNTNPLSPGLQ